MRPDEAKGESFGGVHRPAPSEGQKENEERERRREWNLSKPTVRKGLLLSSVALVALLLSTPLAQANVYAGYDSFTEPLGLQSWELWVRIVADLDADINKDGIVDVFDVLIVGVAFGSELGDPNWDPRADLYRDGIIDSMDVLAVGLYFGEETHKLYFKWQTNGDWPYTEFMAAWAQTLSYIKVWDGKGFYWHWGPNVIPAHGLDGEITLDYPNTFTWLYVKVRWAYQMYPLNTYYYVVLTVATYVES